MHSFWTLTGFEYKKILQKRSTLLVLLATLVASVLSCHALLLGNTYVDGVPIETRMETMKTDRRYSRALAGRAIDSALLLEMADGYAKIPTDGKYTDTEEYHLYARPYSNIYGIARTVYNGSTHKFDVKSAGALTEEQAEAFYQARTDKVAENTVALFASDAAKAHLLARSRQVETPLIYEYCEGYTRFFAIMYTTGMIACFAAAIFLSPLFSGEYASGADQLILSSKHGKKTLIFAKLFTGMTLAGGLVLLLIVLTYLQCMLTYGFDGVHAALQLYMPLCVYPLTMGQAALLYSICIFMGVLLATGVTMLLSSKMKTAFGVIVLIGILLIVPMFIADPEKSAVLSNLFCLLPSNMMAFWNVTSPHLFQFGAVVIEPALFMPMFAGAASLVLLPLAYRGFQNHQIG